MRRLIIIINLSLIVAFMMMFADCSNSSKDRKLVSIGYVNWSEGIAAKCGYRAGLCFDGGW